MNQLERYEQFLGELQDRIAVAKKELDKLRGQRDKLSKRVYQLNYKHVIDKKHVSEANVWLAQFKKLYTQNAEAAQMSSTERPSQLMRLEEFRQLLEHINGHIEEFGGSPITLADDEELEDDYSEEAD